MAESVSGMLLDNAQERDRQALERDVASRLTMAEDHIRRLAETAATLATAMKTGLEEASRSTISAIASRDQDSIRELTRVESELKAKIVEIQSLFREKEKRELDDRNTRDRDRRLSLAGYVTTVVSVIGVLAGGGIAWGNSLKAAIEADNVKATQILVQSAQKTDTELGNRITALESSEKTHLDNWRDSINATNARLETYIKAERDIDLKVENEVRELSSNASAAQVDRKHLNEDTSAHLGQITELQRSRTQEREHQAEVETQIKSIEHQIWTWTQENDREFVQLHLVTKLPSYLPHSVFPDISSRKLNPDN